MAVPSARDTATYTAPGSVTPPFSVAVTVTSLAVSELPSRRTDGLTLSVMLGGRSLSTRVMAGSSEVVRPPPAALVKTMVSSSSTMLSSTGVIVSVPPAPSSPAGMDNTR